MEANELRLGNLVWNEVQQIAVPADVKIISEQHYRQKHFKARGIDLGIWKPVPLTDEWLVKFGFREELLYWVIDMMGTELSIIKESGSALVGLEHECGGTDLKIQHVNQLQNLYHSHTLEELTIK